MPSCNMYLDLLVQVLLGPMQNCFACMNYFYAFCPSHYLLQPNLFTKIHASSKFSGLLLRNTYYIVGLSPCIKLLSILLSVIPIAHWPCHFIASIYRVINIFYMYIPS